MASKKKKKEKKKAWRQAVGQIGVREEEERKRTCEEEQPALEQLGVQLLVRGAFERTGEEECGESGAAPPPSAPPFRN